MIFFVTYCADTGEVAVDDFIVWLVIALLYLYALAALLMLTRERC